MGYMPELNVLCAIDDYSPQSDQPLMKHVVVETPVRLINIFNTRKYKDISLNRWMALTPPALVRGHLDLDDTVMAALRPDRGPVVR